MREADFKRTVFDHLAAVGTALADPRRVAALEFICQGPKAVEAVADEIKASVAVASHHLRWLKRAGLAADRRSGRRIFYRATDLGVDLWRALSAAGEKHIDGIREATERFFQEDGEHQATPLPELLRRVEHGEVVLIDVRPRDEFETGHLPGAISIPLEEIQARIAELPRNREIAAYCRGPYCVLSHEAVALLRHRGRRAFRIAASPLDGRRAGQRASAIEPSRTCSRGKARR